MVGHVPRLHVLCDLEATFRIHVLCWESQGHATMALTAGVADGLFMTTGRKGELLVALGAGEVISCHATVAGGEAE